MQCVFPTFPREFRPSPCITVKIDVQYFPNGSCGLLGGPQCVRKEGIPWLSFARARRRLWLRKRVQKAAPARKEDVILQFGGQEWNTAELVERAKAAYAAEGHRMSSIKTIRLYVKPEEQKAYYVINDKATGSIEL